MEWADGKIRCRWANPKNEKYIRYHDEEWGVPVYDDHKLLEMLVLESFQAGLSWECVLNKREDFRQAFDGFDLEKVCSYDEVYLEKLLENPKIIRNRLKIRAAVSNAVIFRKIQQEWGSFSAYIWHWTEGKVIYEKGLSRSELSDAVSEDLKKRGMKFAGTTIIYAYLQSVGVINSHEEGCFLDNQEKKHRRRVRYSGAYPKNYKEKYKELNPEKYTDTISRVIQKGSTPAGMHISICVDEILDFLQIKPGQTGLDATLGYGGHTLEMLKCLNGQGHLHALDIDPIESEKTKKRLESLGYGPEILTVHLKNFADVDQVSDQAGKFDFILADLGVSSMQIDNPDRGFSYKTEGPLDLRMNPLQGISAAKRLKHITQEELKGMLTENSDEPYAEEISRGITDRLKKGREIETTTQLYETIESALAFLPEKERIEAVKKSSQRTFQALRIDVNNEFETLYELLGKLPDVLAPNGRVAILTFHSGEDRLVKKSFKQFFKDGIYSEINKDVIRPSMEECSRNSRARSTKMRWAVRAE